MVNTFSVKEDKLTYRNKSLILTKDACRQLLNHLLHLFKSKKSKKSRKSSRLHKLKLQLMMRKLKKKV
jgi:hypothetical protein